MQSEDKQSSYAWRQRQDDIFLDDSEDDRLLYDYVRTLDEDTLLYEAAAEYERAAAVGYYFSRFYHTLYHASF